jgi:predicted  nucleic acid-binding Zn-ribbon protein
MSVTSALRECHRLRAHLRTLQAEIDRGPRVRQTHQDDLEAARRAHKDHHDAITKLKLKQREDEGSLKQTEVRLAKLEDQLPGLTVQKEYAAKEHEIEMARAKKGELEDAILATIMELEERTAGIPAAEQAWAQAQADFKQFEADAAERLAGMRADQDASNAELARAEATLPAEVKRTYDTVVKAKGADALAGAKDRVCQACRATMTETQFGTLRAGTFRTCTSCGRIQYPVE